MRVAILSTYPPRRCGIATFAADLHRSLCAAPGVTDVDVIAVDDKEVQSDTASIMTTVARGARADYGRAARLVGRLGIDVVMIQHEFGIYGGRDGDYVLTFAGELAVPYAVTLHTVVQQPSPGQARVLAALCGPAAAVLVFTQRARDVVVSSGIADAERVHVVPHGAPVEISDIAQRDEPRPMFLEGEPASGRRDSADRFVVSTFGLLSPGKGVEVAIEAVAKLVPQFPHILLVVAGQTHPEVARRDGEGYRLSLQRLTDELGVSDHVVFDDRFLEISEVAELLAATDVFVTTYHEREQAVSGALTFALAAGCPVVSTRYRYAVDLLSDGAGTLVAFGDSGEVHGALAELLEHPDRLQAMRNAARAVGAGLSWPAVGRATAELLGRAAGLTSAPSRRERREPRLAPVRTGHLSALVDDVGIVQHAVGAVPNRSTGYCVDDVARLAPVAHRLAERTGGEDWSAVTVNAVAFLAHALATRCGEGMHNTMAYDRRWIDHPHHGDHVARSLAACGELLDRDIPAALRVAIAGMVERLCREITSPSAHTAAYALIGLARGSTGTEPAKRRLAEELVGLLRAGHDASSRPGWDWFEPVLAYESARLSQALIVGGRLVDDPGATELGLRTLRWLGDECGLDARVVQLPGNAGRRRGQPHPGLGDEQPIDAAALVEAEIDALRTTGDAVHGDRALAAFAWFTGRNRLGLLLHDPATGGCCDGLTADSVNINQGAESTLVYLSARLALEEAGLPLIGQV